MQLAIYMKILAFAAVGIQGAVAVPHPNGIEGGPLAARAEPIEGLRIVAVGPDGKIRNETENEHLQKRTTTTNISAWLFKDNCSGPSDFTWNGGVVGECFSFIDGNGNLRDMYSLSTPGHCDFRMYHNDHACGSGILDQSETTCANRAGSSIKSFKLLRCD